jgi:hypothetical protein
VVSLPRCPSLILISTIENSEDTEDHHNNLANEIDCVTGVVLGSIRRDVRPPVFRAGQLTFTTTVNGKRGVSGSVLRCNNTTNGTKRNNITAGYSLYSRPAGVWTAESQSRGQYRRNRKW